MNTLTQADMADKFATLIATGIALEKARMVHLQNPSYETALAKQHIELRRDELRRLLKPTLVH